MKNLFFIILGAVVLLAGCTGKHKMAGDRYPAEYTTIDSMPYNIQLNSHAQWEKTSTYPDYTSLKLSYPEYEADGILTVVMLDSARLLTTMDRYLERMEMRADTIGDIIDIVNPAGIQTWMFVFPGGKEQLQWMATDSMTMYVAGNIHFKAASDTTVDITPALDNVKADIAHMLKNLTVEK